MLKKADARAVAPEALPGARSATGSAPGAAEVKRWSTGRKRGVVLRLLRGEPVDALSREVGVTCPRRANFEPPRRLNSEPGWRPV